MDSEEEGLIAQKLAERSEKIANMVSSSYQIGDAVVLDTVDGHRYFGFYVGINTFPQLMIMIAHCCMNFKGGWDKKWFDNIVSIPTANIQYFNAVPAKR